jgi:uncharacterized protein (DUF924 family)
LVNKEDPPNDPWVSNDLWLSITKLERVCNGIAESFVRNLTSWKNFILDSQNPSATRETVFLPDDWENNLTDFQRMIILKSLCGDKLLYDEMLHFIVKHLGKFPN